MLSFSNGGYISILVLDSMLCLTSLDTSQPGCRGAGVFCRELGFELHFRLNDDCGVFQAKIYAILKATEAKAGGPASDSETYMIYVDS